jgi:hypothetical protein
LRFRDASGYVVTAFPPNGEQSAVTTSRPTDNIGFSSDLWTPLTVGDVQDIVVRRTDPVPNRWEFEVVAVSHIESAVTGDTNSLFPGQSAYCQTDIACVYAVAPSQMLAGLPLATRAVSMLVVTDATGNSYSCTGTLLNSANYPQPIIYTANHCFPDAQSIASLTTYWFYARDNCGFGPPSANTTQVAGGSVALYLSASFDAAVVLMNYAPPLAAAYSGWDASAITTTTTILAIHHPRGDVKKGSLGDVVGVNTTPVPFSDLGTFPPYTFYMVDWDVGIVEHGSSGSGLFTYDSTKNLFYTRGTLTGGNATCSGIRSRTFYSEMHNVYPYISDILNTKVAPPGQLQLPSPVSFASQLVGTPSAPLTLTLKNIGGRTVTVSSVTGTDLDEFPGTTDCGGSIPTGGTCQITLSFQPSSAGAHSETITVTSDGVGSPQSFSVSGTGTTGGSSTTNYQGIWWNSGESGWGVNLAHQGDTIFASWFTYDQFGHGWWLVMTALKTAPNTYTGTLYETKGPPFSATIFDPSAVVATARGTGTLVFTDSNNGTFSCAVAGVTQSKSITRQLFGPLPVCSFGTQPNLSLATNYQDLWWKSSESGWGINLNHEGDTIFATWFTYDLAGSPLWLVVTASKTGPRTYGGDLYRTTGGRFDSFNPTSVSATKVGTATFGFTDGNNATFTYSVQLAGMASPVTQSKSISRQVFTAPGTTCN